MNNTNIHPPLLYWTHAILQSKMATMGLDIIEERPKLLSCCQSRFQPICQRILSLDLSEKEGIRSNELTHLAMTPQLLTPCINCEIVQQCLLENFLWRSQISQKSIMKFNRSRVNYIKGLQHKTSLWAEETGSCFDHCSSNISNSTRWS